MSPFGPGMVIDNQTGFSFHSKMKSKLDSDGKLKYIVGEVERQEIHEKEKSKIEHLRNNFKRRLNSDTGSIYLIKANDGIDTSEVIKLTDVIKMYSKKHVLVEVRAQNNVNGELLMRMSENYYRASISRFAPYVAANDVLYDEWNGILETLQDKVEISKKLA